MENPYLATPQVESGKSRSWGLGFVYGFQGPDLSSTAQADVETEDADAFNEGVLAGQQAALNGLPFEPACVDLNVKRPEFGHLALEAPGAGMTLIDVFKAITGAGEVAAEAAAGAIVGGVLDLVLLSIALETFSDDPEKAMVQAGARLQDALRRLGYDQSLQLFIGGGVDVSEETVGCELKLTPIFRSQDAATDAAKAIGRPSHFVASWRTDQCGGISIVDQG